MLKPEEFPKDNLGSKFHAKPDIPNGLCLPCNFLWTPLRTATSKKKKRYIKNGFNIDLTYIDDKKKIMTMGFPSTGFEHLYRNPRKEIHRFLETFHQKHYKVYNFCCEPGRGYTASQFNAGMVERYPFRDHSVPFLETMLEFTNSAKLWLDADPENVVALHCKAGKGRAGVMTTCLLLRMGIIDDVEEAIQYYGKQRTKDGKGLTVPSQLKYVRYFAKYWREGLGVMGNLGNELAVPIKDGDKQKLYQKYPMLEEYVIQITSIQFLYFNDIKKALKIKTNKTKNKDNSNKKNEKLTFKVIFSKGTQFDPIVIHEAIVSYDEELNTLSFSENPISVKGNFAIKIEYMKNKKKKGKGMKLWENWANTAFFRTDQYSEDIVVSQIDMKSKIRKKMTKKCGMSIKYQYMKEEDNEKETTTTTTMPKKINLSNILREKGVQAIVDAQQIVVKEKQEDFVL